MKRFVIGVDFGSDSCRALVVNALTGVIESSAVSMYGRWAKGMYCDASSNQYRQHPQDYIDSFEEVMSSVLAAVSDEVRANVVGLAFDTTGSTPVLIDKNGTPLAFLEEFKENPNAMFVLWKDHTAIKEAEQINELARRSEVDFTSYSGGIYSSEWAWSKMLHVLRVDSSLRAKAYSWVEHCDWMTGLVTGNVKPEMMFRSRCAAGHKAMWSEKWGGLPSQEFLSELDPLLDGIRDRLFTKTYTGDHCAGVVTAQWAAKFGLPTDVRVSVGLLDAHMGAVGAGAKPNVLVRIMGTSTCDIMAVDANILGDKLIPGICGQVDGSVIPGYVGLEAGQSAFGDIYAWFKSVLMWPMEEYLKISDEKEFDVTLCEKLLNRFSCFILPALSEAAAKIDPIQTHLMALDWMNGRRTPDADFSVQGAITGLTLGTSAPMIFRSLVEATAYGSRAIVDRLKESGIEIKGVIAIGGIAKKSPLVMQTLSDVLNLPIEVTSSDQTCALGAAMYAAVASGVYPSLAEAQKALDSGISECYHPDAKRVAVYEELYRKYHELGNFEQSKK